MRLTRIALLIAAALTLPALVSPSFADDEPAGSSSSSSSYFRGYGGTASNVFSPRYKERLANFAAQIDNGAAKGWLTAAEAETFRNQVFALHALEQEVSAKGYPKEELDDMEKRFNELNVRLSQTMSKGTPPAPVTTDGGTAAGGDAAVSTDAASAKPDAQPASKPGSKVPASPGKTPAGTTKTSANATKAKGATKSKATAKKKKVVAKTSTTKKKFKRP